MALYDANRVIGEGQPILSASSRFDSMAHILARTNPETQRTRSHSGFPQYRHGDSNPGFRRERAAS